MKKAKVLVSVLLSILTLISAITLSGCTPQVNIDFKECVSATFSGYDGEGRATIDVDRGYVLSLLKDMNSVSAMGLASTFTLGTVENNGELSNGDVIKIKIGTNDEALKKAGVTVSNTELEFTVEGLEEKPELITSVSQLTDENKMKFRQAADDHVNQQVDEIVGYSKSIIERILEFTNAYSVDNVEYFDLSNIRFNSAYLICNNSDTTTYYFNAQVPSEQSCIYYIYDSDVKYKCTYSKIFCKSETAEDSANYSILVKIILPEKLGDEINYSSIKILYGGKDADYIYENYISSLLSLEKSQFEIEKIA